MTIPSVEQYLEWLESLHIFAAMTMLVVGAVYLLMGWRIFKPLVMLNAMAIGFAGGMWVGTRTSQPNMDVILGAVGGVLLAVVAWPLMKWAVSIMGALAGAAVGFASWRYVSYGLNRPGFVDLSWVGALIGLIVMGLLAFVIFKMVVMLLTGLQGASLMFSGVCALMMQHPPMRENIVNTLTARAYLIPLLTVLAAVIGAIFQEVHFDIPASKKRNRVNVQSRS